METPGTCGFSTYLRTWATVFGPYHWPIGFPSPTPIWAAAFRNETGTILWKLLEDCLEGVLDTFGKVSPSLLTDLMDGIIAVFFVNEGVENADVLFSLFLVSGPSPV